MRVAPWVSPLTTGLGIVVLLGLLAALIALEAARQRPGRAAPPVLARSALVLGTVLAVDIVARFALLAHGH